MYLVCLTIHRYEHHNFPDITACQCTFCVNVEQHMDVDQDPEPSTSKSIPAMSPNTKQTLSMEIRKKYPPAAILQAAMMTHHEFQNKSAKKIHKMLIDDPVSNGKKLLDGLLNSSDVTKVSNFEGLAFLLHNDMTVDHYNCAKAKSDQCNAKFLPCYR